MINNYKDFLKFLESLDYRPKLLLHSCCAPCSTHTIKLLQEYFDITIYYSNDNIYPYDEFKIRSIEQVNFASEINSNIKVIVDDYDKKNFDESVKGYENLGERSERCFHCYNFRLEKTAIYAKKHNFDYFTTTLSISPYKNSDWINKIGYELELKYGVKFLYSNFKKDEGYKDSIKMSNDYHLYRQDYCGCIYSLAERRNKE